MTTDEAVHKVRRALLVSDDLRQPKYQGNANPFTGHCYVACEVVRHLSEAKLTARIIHHEGTTHWFLRDSDSWRVVDPTSDQFTELPNYGTGHGCGFLPTKAGLSKRARLLLERIKAV